jgi:Uma2 family endonuclease
MTLTITGPEMLSRLEAMFPDQRFEITEEGDYHPIMSPSYEHASLALELQFWLVRFVEQMRVRPTGHFQTHLHGNREPDIAVLDGREVPKAWAPPAQFVSLVIEINSPSNLKDDWELKMAAYAHSGIRHYWIVGLDERVTMLTLAHDPTGQPIYVQAHGETPTVAELIKQDQLPVGVLLDYQGGK